MMRRDKDRKGVEPLARAAARLLPSVGEVRRVDSPMKRQRGRR